MKRNRETVLACNVGDCALGDHVMFNANGSTIDGHISKIRQTRNGRRFHVKPMPDVTKHGAGWILGFATPVLKIERTDLATPAPIRAARADRRVNRAGG